MMTINHTNEMTKKILYVFPYQDFTTSIENYFSILKSRL